MMEDPIGTRRREAHRAIARAEDAARRRDPAAIAESCGALRRSLVLDADDPVRVGPKLRGRARLAEFDLAYAVSALHDASVRDDVEGALRDLGSATVDGILESVRARRAAIEEARVAARFMTGDHAVVSWPATRSRSDVLEALAALRADGAVVREGGFPTLRARTWRLAANGRG